MKICRSGLSMFDPISCKRHYFPPQAIAHAVSLHFRPRLGFRLVESAKTGTQDSALPISLRTSKFRLGLLRTQKSQEYSLIAARLRLSHNTSRTAYRLTQ
jgi:hypothetical protein